MEYFNFIKNSQTIKNRLGLELGIFNINYINLYESFNFIILVKSLVQ